MSIENKTEGRDFLNDLVDQVHNILDGSVPDSAKELKEALRGALSEVWKAGRVF